MLHPAEDFSYLSGWVLLADHSAAHCEVISSFPFPLLGCGVSCLLAQFSIGKHPIAFLQLQRSCLGKTRPGQEGERGGKQRDRELRHGAGWEVRKMRLRKLKKASIAMDHICPYVLWQEDRNETLAYDALVQHRSQLPKHRAYSVKSK